MKHYQKKDVTQKLNPQNEASKDRIKLQIFFNKLMEEYQKCHSSIFKAKEDKVGFFKTLEEITDKFT